MIGALTPLCNNHASATWAVVAPFSFATSSVRSTTSKSSGRKNLSAKYLSVLYLDELGVFPRRYLPVRNPLAKGLQGSSLFLDPCIMESSLVLLLDSIGCSGFALRQIARSRIGR